jgi:hypothetical protein
VFLITMFENSPTNVQEYPCPTHRREKVTHICTDFRCTMSPLLCGYCFGENCNRSQHGGHEEFLLPIHEAIPELALIIESSKGEMAKLFGTTAGKKENELLLHKMEMGERHYVMIDNHIKSLKTQVEREVEALQTEFSKRLQAHKLGVFAQLDNYQKLYVQNMETYRAMVEPVITFNGKSKYYASPNSISLKLLAEIRRKSVDWYMELKRVMTVVSRIADRPLVVYDNFNRATQYMNSACEELPFARLDDARDNREARTLRMQAFIGDCIS